MRTGIMLCYPYESKRLSKWGSKFLIQPKLDGDRCRAIFDSEGKVTLLSSEENEFKSVPHITQQLEEVGYKNIELDGELYQHSMNHQAIHGIVSRTVNLHPDYLKAEYHIFDIVNEDEQKERIETLNNLVEETDYIKLVRTDYGYSEDDILEALAEYSSLGYEGVILRNLTSSYIRKRSTGIMKLKPRKEDEYLIIGYEEEVSIQGEPKNTLGALWLSSSNNDKFKVGSGSYLTKESRKNLWMCKERLLNKIARIKYQELTDRQVPMFPVLIDIIGG
jgi:ATP-dependent DNA ligase